MIDSEKILSEFWKQLPQSCFLEIQVKGSSEVYGEAAIHCEFISQSKCIFKEEGVWKAGALAGTSFKNCMRWSVDCSRLHLEHLRYGAKKPVFLQTFKVCEKNHLVGQLPHQCHLDTYLGSITWNSSEILLQWKIEGPKKNKILLCKYKKS